MSQMEDFKEKVKVTIQKITQFLKDAKMELKKVYRGGDHSGFYCFFNSGHY
jgi:hypothetical protein